jgi:hypothetical protein
MNPAILVLVGGGAALAYVGYDWMQYKMRVRTRRDTPEKGASRFVSFDWKVYMMIGLSLLLGALFARPITRDMVPEGGVDPVPTVGHAYMVAIFVTLVGIWWSIRQARKVAISRRMLINEQVTDLVHQFRSVFRIRPTVFSALEEANRKIEAPTGAAVSHAVTTFYVTALPKRAFEELRERIQNPYMDQFIYILERGEDARHEDILEALDGLLKRLRRARDVRDKSEVNMTVISGQTRIIQIIAVSLVTIVAIAPGLRLAYESPIGQVVFIVIASVGVITSWYIDRKSQALRERVL